MRRTFSIGKLVGLLLLLGSTAMVLWSQQEELFPGPQLLVLGTAQDAGYPQAACIKSCCARHWEGNEPKRGVVSLGIHDPASRQLWLIEATPDFREQWHTLQQREPGKTQPDGILLTHAHMGHYTGLLHLGREVMGADSVLVWAMPKMQQFLSQNGPWSQLVELGNIVLKPLEADRATSLGTGLTVMPWLVPHRDEWSETVGFVIEGPRNRVLFLPDIDKWDRWDRDLAEVLRSVDYALIDATFFKNGELPNRDMREIPHPFVEETISLLMDLPTSEKSKVYFIHMNHTNPLLWQESAREEVRKMGFHVAEEGMIIDL